MLVGQEHRVKITQTSVKRTEVNVHFLYVHVSLDNTVPFPF